MALARVPSLVALSVASSCGLAAPMRLPPIWVGDSRAVVRLITATDNIAADSTLEAGLEFRFAKGWHGLLENPGETRASRQRSTGLLQKNISGS